MFSVHVLEWILLFSWVFLIYRGYYYGIIEESYHITHFPHPPLMQIQDKNRYLFWRNQLCLHLRNQKLQRHPWYTCVKIPHVYFLLLIFYYFCAYSPPYNNKFSLLPTRLFQCILARVLAVFGLTTGQATCVIPGYSAKGFPNGAFVASLVFA